MLRLEPLTIRSLDDPPTEPQLLCISKSDTKFLATICLNVTLPPLLDNLH